MASLNEHVFDRLRNGGTVVTSTKRLARELSLGFDAHQLTSGHAAWPTADILPYGAWLERLWQQFKVVTSDHSLLLQNTQLQQIWCRIIESHVTARYSNTAPLWNIHSTAHSAIQAWRLLKLWKLSLQDLRMSTLSDQKNFNQWQNQFRDECAKNNWIDEFSIADVLAESLQTDQSIRDHAHISRTSICFHGFDVFTPQQRELSESLQGIGVDVLLTGFDTKVPETKSARFTDNTEELLAAARWTRKIIETDPVARVAIVCPDLTKYRESIANTLRQVLTPDDVLHPVTEDAAFHISLGSSLDQQPVVRDALAWLMALASRSVSLSEFESLITSPYTDGSRTEQVNRALLSQHLHRSLSVRNRLDFLHKWLLSQSVDSNTAPAVPKFVERLGAAISLAISTPARARMQDWHEHFCAWLDALGWPGEVTLHSAEYQQVDAFLRLSRSLQSLDRISDEYSCFEALDWLRRLSRQQSFQIESGSKPVQVLGALEASGLQFDAIWFIGATEEDWPPALNPNPFLPLHTQRQAGIPQANLEENLALALRLQQRLMSSCNEIFFSSSRFDREVPLQPSTLLPTVTGDFEDDPLVSLYDQFLDATVPDWIAAESGPPRTSKTKAAGGANLIQLQAHCPCCAFATYRLGAGIWQQREDGVTPPERGSMIHHALQLMWAEIGDSRSLHNLQQNQLVSLCTDSLRAASKRFLITSGCGESYFETLSESLKFTILEWFEFERQRVEPFSVESTESRLNVTFSGVEIELSIDRIDRFEDGSLGLIDYKTGRTDSPRAWWQQRPVSPQLPLYVSSLDTPVSLVAFGKLEAGDCRMIGIANDNRELPFAEKIPGVYPYKHHNGLGADVPDWNELLQDWRHQIEEMCSEFDAGFASVDPLREGICEQCGMPSFCRGDGEYRQ
ncbi:MAG: PD-(D/E)XK nuclease family protein [Pseudomonadota bacterium]